MTEQHETPRVWIGSLHAYNDGRLIGEWTDADDLDVMREVAAKVLKAGGGEEVALMDREGFGDLIGEYTQLEKVAEIAEAIAEHGPALIAYAENESGRIERDDVSDVVSDFKEAYKGEHKSFKAFAEDEIEELGWAGLESIPAELWPYLDMDAIANALGEDYWDAPAPDYSVYVFDARC